MAKKSFLKKMVMAGAVSVGSVLLYRQMEKLMENKGKASAQDDAEEGAEAVKQAQYADNMEVPTACEEDFDEEDSALQSVKEAADGAEEIEETKEAEEIGEAEEIVLEQAKPRIITEGTEEGTEGFSFQTL